jgi:hypothetical protein
VIALAEAPTGAEPAPVTLAPDCTWPLCEDGSLEAPPCTACAWARARASRNETTREEADRCVR